MYHETYGKNMKRVKLIVEVETRLSRRDARVFIHDAVERRFNDRAYTGKDREHVKLCEVILPKGVSPSRGFLGYRNAKPKKT